MFGCELADEAGELRAGGLADGAGGLPEVGEVALLADGEGELRVVDEVDLLEEVAGDVAALVFCVACCVAAAVAAVFCVAG